MRASEEDIAADLLGRYQITELPNGFIRVSDKVSGLEHTVKSGERMPSSVRSRLQFLQGHGSTPEQYMETLRGAARREFTPGFRKMVLDAEKFHSGRAPSPAGVSLLAPTRPGTVPSGPFKNPGARAEAARIYKSVMAQGPDVIPDEVARAISDDARDFLRAAGVTLREAGEYGEVHVIHPQTDRLVDPRKFIREVAKADELATGSDMTMYAEEILFPRRGSSKNAEWMRRVRQMGEKVRPHINRLAPKALATGVAAKLMLGGAAKAAGLPGVAEVAEMVGREDPSLQQFFRDESLFSEENITGALGLPQRSQMPVYSMDPAREGAARVMLRTGRENLRPGFDQPLITKQELEYVKKKAAPRPK